MSYHSLALRRQVLLVSLQFITGYLKRYINLVLIDIKTTALLICIISPLQSLAAAACFFYSSKALLSVQLSILAVLATLGTGAFCRVEWAGRARARAAALEAIDKTSPATHSLADNTLHYD